MKVVVAGPYPINVDKISGGVEAVMVYLVEGLKNINNLDLHVVSFRKNIDKEVIIQKENYSIYYIPFVKRFGNITFGILNKHNINKIIKKINPDIVHAQGQSTFSYASLTNSFPTVITVHGIRYEEAKLKKGILNWIRKFPNLYIERFCLKKATDIISISPYVQEVTNNLTNANFYAIENPISRKYFQIENKEISGRILFAGFIIRIKNLLCLLKAINILKREIPDLSLRIAGAIQEAYYHKILNEYIRNKGLYKNVVFLGHLLEEEILEEYAKCCLLVLPSFQETAPMVIQQAMAAGKSVVATRTGGVKYLIENGKTGFLVDIDDEKGLAERIRLLITNSELRRIIGENAKKEALRRFTPDVVAHKTYQVYKQILKAK